MKEWLSVQSDLVRMREEGGSHGYFNVVLTPVSVGAHSRFPGQVWNRRLPKYEAGVAYPLQHRILKLYLWGSENKLYCSKVLF
jgi:hypothetical protein